MDGYPLVIKVVSDTESTVDSALIKPFLFRNQVRSLKYDDFKKAMSVIRPSLNKSKWEELEKWNQEFGSN